MTKGDHLTKVRLLGLLADEFGSDHEFLITQPRDVVKGLSVNFPGFKQRILELHDDGWAFQITAPNKPDGIGEDELDNPLSPTELVLTPVPIQSGGSFGKILLGIALIGISLAVPFGAIGGATKLGLLGGALVLSGVSGWLTPKTQTRKAKQEEQVKSSAFNSVTGIASVDHPIPLLYGKLRIRGLPVISGGVSTAPIAV